MAKQQTHLTEEQQQKLASVLRKHDKLFSGQLGCYPHMKVHVEVQSGARPVHSRPHAVPKVNEAVFKKELQHLCELGVLSCAGASEWAAPTMAIPKKDGRIRMVCDFRELNKVIKRKVYPLPNIN